MSFRKRLTFCNVWLKKINKLLPSAEEETSSNVQASYNPKQILFRWALERQLLVPSSKTCSHSRPQVIFLVKFPSIAVVIARGLSVPTPGIAGPLVSRKLLCGSQKKNVTISCHYIHTGFEEFALEARKPVICALGCEQASQICTYGPVYNRPWLFFTLNSYKL